jgi:hypothetical protein
MKKLAQSWQIAKRNLSIHSQKHPSPNSQTSTTRMGFFLGQASMHNYSSSYLLHTPQSLKALKFFLKHSGTTPYNNHVRTLNNRDQNSKQ